MANYQIRQLEIGYDNHFPLGVALDMWEFAGEQAYSPFTVTLLEGEGHKILVDCGFDPDSEFGKAKIALENDQNCRNIRDVLQANGLEPEEIDTLIITHCHWDHMGGLKFFADTNTRIYVQEEELRKWQQAMEDPSFPVTHKRVVEEESVALLAQWAESGKVTLLRGETEELLPGIRLCMAGGHSFAQTYLLVDNGGEHLAIIGDMAMRPESFVGSEANPCYLPNLKFSVGSIGQIVASYDRIIDWVEGNVDNIFMVHDGTLPQKRSATVNELGLHCYHLKG